MSALLLQRQGAIARLHLNRPEVSNAFDDALIGQLLDQLQALAEDDTVRAVILGAEGKHFSAGADLNWMKRMAQYDEAANLADAKALASLMHHLNSLPKPVIAEVKGAAFGGALGLIACCDIAIAADNSRFCFSEAKLGLAPAAISPYVINAMGARACRRYFLTAEVFTAAEALATGLIHETVPPEQLNPRVDQLAQQIIANGPEALAACKVLIDRVGAQTPAQATADYTAQLIAGLRVGAEGQEGLSAFLDKREPAWRQAAEGGDHRV